MPAVGSNVGYKMCVTGFSLLTVCSDVFIFYFLVGIKSCNTIQLIILLQVFHKNVI